MYMNGIDQNFSLKPSIEIIEQEEKEELTSKTITSQLGIQCLSWHARTEEINQAISRSFEEISNDTKSNWGAFNGNIEYRIAGIREDRLMIKMIKEAPLETKDFYALDVGSGNYQWGRRLANCLNDETDLPKDITIHIIGIRGESNLNETVTEIGRCKLYELGHFQIERLTDEFENEGLQLANKVDLVVSRWCFRHLVDPVGTFIQTYDLLRPQTGHLIFDGFYFFDEIAGGFNEKMIRLCLETGAPFLTRDHENCGSLNHFIMRKTDSHPCHLYKEYLGIKNVDRSWTIGSQTITRFKPPEGYCVDLAPLQRGGVYRGDKSMYEWLRQNGLLYNSSLVWGPLQDSDVDKKTPSFHSAIINGNEESIGEHLRDGCDINESDDRGFTPLHLSIKHKNYGLFLQLLELGALKNLFAEECTPLHLAAECDFEGPFIQALIVAGADLNIKNECGGYQWSPLDYAIVCDNCKAAELLIKAGAIVSEDNRKSLDRESINTNS